MKNEELVQRVSGAATLKTIVTTRIACSRTNSFRRLLKSIVISGQIPCAVLRAQTSSPLSGDQIIDRASPAEVYDRVEMITADERRDIAALRIPATDLPVLPVANFDAAVLSQLRLEQIHARQA